MGKADQAGRNARRCGARRGRGGRCGSRARGVPVEGRTQTRVGDQAQTTRAVSVRQTLPISLAPQKCQMMLCSWELQMTTETRKWHYTTVVAWRGWRPARRVGGVEELTVVRAIGEVMVTKECIGVGGSMGRKGGAGARVGGQGMRTPVAVAGAGCQVYSDQGRRWRQRGGRSRLGVGPCCTGASGGCGRESGYTTR